MLPPVKILKAVLEGESAKAFVLRNAGKFKRFPKPDEVDYETIWHEELDSPEGNFSNYEDVSWVYDQLQRGNAWAWCAIEVVASYTDGSGHKFTGSEFLAGCSYNSKQDFESPDNPYYSDMKWQAYDRLVVAMEEAYGLKKS